VGNASFPNSTVAGAIPRVAVTTYALDGEGASLASQIIASLNKASIEVDNRLAAVMPVGGFAFAIHVSGADTNLVNAIRSALGVIGRLLVAPSDVQAGVGGSMEMVPGSGSKPIDASILVGIKPVPIIR
jgi:hypothetical protein